MRPTLLPALPAPPLSPQVRVFPRPFFCCIALRWPGWSKMDSKSALSAEQSERLFGSCSSS